MKVSTSRFGHVEVPDDAVLEFPAGLVGLPSHTRYVVFDVEEGSDYQWLQSIEDESLAVVIVPADYLQTDFHQYIPAESVDDLEIGEGDAFSVMVIVTIPPGKPQEATANLRAPIVVNLRTRKAKQTILQESIPLQMALCGELEPEAKEVNEPEPVTSS